jgi:hypothetical protein
VQAIVKNLKGLAGLAHKSAPYLLLEILLPGGTLFALLLFLHHHGRIGLRSERARRMRAIVARSIETVHNAVAIARPYDIVAVTTARAAGDSDGLEPLAMAPGW